MWTLALRSGGRVAVVAAEWCDATVMIPTLARSLRTRTD